MKVALVYDRVNKIGGAEKVLMAIHDLWPKAPLFTGVYNKKSAKWADGWEIRTSFVQKLPFSKSNHEWYFWLMPMAFETFNFDEFDVVISVTSAEAKGIITKPETLHVSYILTPTRYLWSHEKLYLKTNPLGEMGKWLLMPMIKWMKKWDEIAARRPDLLVPISNTVKKRIRKFYKMNTEAVIYPPVDFGFYQKKRKPIIKSGYYLTVARQVPSKRVDLAIKAFNRLEEKLVVVGSGIEENRLRRIANKNIMFAGQVSDDELAAYYQHCRAVILPQEEDFGIVALEAMSSGKPVIAYNKGGAAETVIDGKTGLLFAGQREVSIIEAIEKFKKKRFSKQELFERALEFETKRFKKQFKSYLEGKWKDHRKLM
jgi:glycosyltransferase involved in cell wall biosynthesis